MPYVECLECHQWLHLFCVTGELWGVVYPSAHGCHVCAWVFVESRLGRVTVLVQQRARATIARSDYVPKQAHRPSQRGRASPAGKHHHTIAALTIRVTARGLRSGTVIWCVSVESCAWVSHQQQQLLAACLRAASLCFALHPVHFCSQFIRTIGSVHGQLSGYQFTDLTSPLC